MIGYFLQGFKAFSKQTAKFYAFTKTNFHLVKLINYFDWESN